VKPYKANRRNCSDGVNAMAAIRQCTLGIPAMSSISTALAKKVLLESRPSHHQRREEQRRWKEYLDRC